MFNEPCDPRCQLMSRHISSPHLQLPKTTTMPKFPEVSVGSQMQISSDRNIRGHFWRGSTFLTEICHSIFDKPFHCPTPFHLCREFGKRNKNGKSPIPLGWPGLIGKCCSIFLGYWYNGSPPTFN